MSARNFGAGPTKVSATLAQCIESMIHAPFQEYRINNGKVESRVLDFARDVHKHVYEWPSEVVFLPLKRPA
jgi:hypothetical protein